MPLTSLGFNLLEVSPYMSPCSSRSRAPLAIGFGCCSAALSAAQAAQLIASVPAFQLSHQQNLTLASGSSPHASPFACWRCYPRCRADPLLGFLTHKHICTRLAFPYPSQLPAVFEKRPLATAHSRSIVIGAEEFPREWSTCFTM